MKLRVLFTSIILARKAVAAPMLRSTSNIAGLENWLLNTHLHQGIFHRQTSGDENDPDNENAGSEPSNDGSASAIVGDVAEGLTDFSPLEDGQFEMDADSGGESDHGGSGSQTANSLLGGGTGSAAHSENTTAVTSSQCTLFACTSASSSGGNSTSSSSSGLVNAPLVQMNDPVIQGGGTGSRAVAVLRT